MSSGIHFTSEYNADVASGAIEGSFSIQKFGANPSVTATETADVTPSGTFAFLTVAVAVRVKVGGNVNDTAAGTGAQSVVILGLDENFDLAEETVVTAGASASSPTTITFIRIYRAYSGDVGAYMGANAGNIIIETTDDTEMIRILAGKGQSEHGMYTIPAGHTGTLTRAFAVVDSNKSADVTLWKHEGADNVSTPFSPKRLLLEFPQLLGPANDAFESVVPIPEKTDLWFTATAGVNDAAVAATMDITVTNNDNLSV